ncbi:MAG: hypothetical protein R2941_09700 [Desulfobacterales bacterium]
MNLHGAHKTPLYASRDNHFAALVTDADMAADIPCFGMEDIRELADFVEKRFLLPQKEAQ